MRWIRNDYPERKALVLLIAVSINALLTALLISRALAYETFWAVPFIPVLVAITAGYGTQFSRRYWIHAGATLLLLLSGTLRMGKIAEVFYNWNERDPAPIKNFACNTSPPPQPSMELANTTFMLWKGVVLNICSRGVDDGWFALCFRQT